jgi:lysozyme family protein
MAKNNFPKCQAFVLKYEGGYVNHPKDPGGATNKGITQRVYDRYRERRGETTRSVKLITNIELDDIYRGQYWGVVKGDDLEEGLDLAVYDYAVNSGAAKAVKDLQRELGVTADGVMGVNTLAALSGRDMREVILLLCARRLKFLKSLKTWGTFGRGWTNRIEALKATALGMVEGEVVHPPANATAAPAKGMVADQAKLKTAEGAGLTAAGCGAAGQTALSTAQTMQPHIGDTLLGRLALAGMAVLMIVGGLLVGYSYLRRINDSGGLGPFLGGLFNAKS